MTLLHFANINFEEELAGKPTSTPLKNVVHSHCYYLYLQFLPFLYAKQKEMVLVTIPPPPEYLDYLEQSLSFVPDWKLFEDPLMKMTLSTWGLSWKVKKWASKHRLSYEIPPTEVVHQIHQKSFAFENSPSLTGSCLLPNKKEAKAWLEKAKFPIVFKENFGASARGIHVIKNREGGHELLKNPLHFPIVAEPFVERLLDFSSQWIIDRKDIHKMGYSQLINSKYGSYLGTVIDEKSPLFQKYLPFIDEHQSIVLPLLKKIQEMGYWGNIGIDAMIYHSPGGPKLKPVVEINARKTLGYVALMLQKNHFRNQRIKMEFRKEKKQGLLPMKLQVSDDQWMVFSKNLFFHTSF